MAGKLPEIAGIYPGVLPQRHAQAHIDYARIARDGDSLDIEAWPTRDETLVTTGLGIAPGMLPTDAGITAQTALAQGGRTTHTQRADRLVGCRRIDTQIGSATLFAEPIGMHLDLCEVGVRLQGRELTQWDHVAAFQVGLCSVCVVIAVCTLRKARKADRAVAAHIL